MGIGLNMRAGCGRVAAIVSIGALALVAASCGGDHNGAKSGTHAAPPLVTSPGSGLFAVNCAQGKAYVPLGTLDASGNGQVAVIDLTADPDVKNPVLKIISLSHADIPTGTALDNDDNLILVVSGKTSGQDGKLDIIDTTTDTLVSGSPFAFPTGSQSGYFGQVLYNPTSHQALVSTCDSATCSSGQTLTGIATFDPSTHVFGSVIPANYPENFAVNSKTNVVIDGSDDDSSGQIGAVDVGGTRACTLSDANIGSDNDGTSFDSTTNITVVSNEDGTASLINLNGSSFAPASGTPCTLNEGGTPPNSVSITGLPGGTAGSAINPGTHQAFLIEDDSPGITLLQLPKSSVTQLTSIPAPTISSIPNDPDGNLWATKGDPYAVAVASCKGLPNKGFAVDYSFNFLVEVDLTSFQKDPTGISTALPAGSCAGVSTTAKCNNGKGVIFFPLTPPAV
jgi:hypothetical protein